MSLIRIPIRRNQIFRRRTNHRNNDLQVMIIGRKKDKWKCVVLTDKPGVYNGTHSMNSFTLWKQFELISE